MKEIEVSEIINNSNSATLQIYLDDLLSYIQQERGWSSHGVKKDIADFIKLTPTEVTRLFNTKRHAKDKQVQVEKLEKIIKEFKIKQEQDADGKIIFSRLLPADDKYLEELAVKLALNLVDVSTRFDEYNEPHKEIIKRDKLDKYRGSSSRRERFILLTGAGLSHVATKGVMPLAKDAIKFIKEEVKKTNIPNHIFEEEAERLKFSTQLDINEFETQLLIYSKYAVSAVKKGLKKICKPKYIPNIEYEILAHMLQHRFIDIVMNFNYDEIFDVILKEEISKGEFKYIYLEGHCPDNYEKEFLIDNRLKQPVYIKPHGTISHTSSLRLDRERISVLPVEIRKLITNMIQAKVPEQDHSEQKFLDVNFIIVGFGMKSPVLLEAIKEYLDSKQYKNPPKFWFFDKKKNLSEFSLGLEPKYREIIEKNSHFFCVDDKDTLEIYLDTLWKKVAESFSDDYPPTGIERHKLINSIFDDNEDAIRRRKTKEYQKVYFRDRLFTELALDILSSDGVTNTQQIMSGRFDHYLHKYNERANSNEQLSIDTAIKKLGFVNYKGFVADVFTPLEPSKFGSDEFLHDFHNKLSEQLSSERGLYYQKNRDEVLGLSRKINQRNRLRINPKFNHPHNGLFSPLQVNRILNTSLNWIYRYRQALEKDNWDLMLAVSERGRFLTPDSKNIQEKYTQIFKDKRAEVILSSLDLPQLKNRIDEDKFQKFNLLSKNVLYLPWWLHNRHLALFMKKNQKGNIESEIENWDFVSGFFYESRMLSRTVNPVLITGKENLEKLFYNFVLYWHKSKQYTEQLRNEKPRYIQISDGSEHLKAQANELLRNY